MRSFFIFLSFLTLASCNHGLARWYSEELGHYKIGPSYQIAGKIYHPQHYDHYEEIGIASWYGGNNHNKKTANGEIFNRNLLSAAHKTLPLPSFVKVTNLKNGRSLVVKVNDRGPFAGNRIIDLSEKAASLLGFKKQGLTKVKVEYLKDMSIDFINSIPKYKKRYEEAVMKRSTAKIRTQDTAGYIAKYKEVKSAKRAVTILRIQGFQNATVAFKNNEYFVYAS